MRDKQGRTLLRMRRHISLLASALLALACGDVGAAGEPLRIGITGVLVEHNRALNEAMITYIGEKVGRPVEILHRNLEVGTLPGTTGYTWRFLAIPCGPRAMPRASSTALQIRGQERHRLFGGRLPATPDLCEGTPRGGR